MKDLTCHVPYSEFEKRYHRKLALMLHSLEYSYFGL